MVLMQSDATTEQPVTARDGVRAAWFAYCVLALLLLAVVDLQLWAGIVIVGAAALATVPPVAADEPHGRQDRPPRGRGTLRRSGGRLRLAFGVFTTDNVLGLFLSFATGMLLGVVGPVVYQVWVRGRDLQSWASACTSGGPPWRWGWSWRRCSSP